jgi:hypothetical protein
MNAYVIAAGLISLASAIFAAVGLLEPGWLGWTAPAPTWVNIGLGVLLGLPIVWLLAFRHHLQSRWALTDESPVAMYAHVEVEKDSESTDYYVCLRTAPGAPLLHRVAVYAPQGRIDTFRTPQAARVFIDRHSGKPLVVDLPGRRLWTMVA